MRGVMVTGVLCLVACSDADNSGPYVPIDMAAQAYRTAWCNHLVMCGEFPDAATCTSANLSISFDTYRTIQAAVLAGKVMYDGSKMARCIAEMTNQTCDVTDADGRIAPIDCENVLHGTLHAGATCALNPECISQECSANCGANTCCTGTCIGDTAPVVTLGAIGQSCGTNGECVAGAYCDNSGNFTCVALKTAGTPCTSPVQCAYGLSCVGQTNRTCGPLPAIGEACPDFMCRDEGTVCNASRTCVEVGLPGAPCVSASDCSSYYTCNVSVSPYVCARGPILGESCAATGTCFDTSYCDITTRICTAPKADGATCGDNTQCASHFCDLSAVTAVCKQPEACI